MSSAELFGGPQPDSGNGAGPTASGAVVSAAGPWPEAGETPLDLCLVQMPFSRVQAPSLALGLLEGYALDHGVRARGIHGDLLWADRVGLGVYLAVLGTQVSDLLGEWVFSAAAFPDFEPDHEAFFRLIEHSVASHWMDGLRQVHPRMDSHRLLHLMRQRAVEFVDELAERILATGARLVGCSSVFQQHCASLALLRVVKEKAPESVTLLGGANCEGEMGITNHRLFPWLDIVVSGEADAFFGDLCVRLLENGADLEPEELPYGVLGPCHRRNGNRGSPATFSEAPRAMVRDLDTLAVPRYDGYFATLGATIFSGYVEPTLLVETSRGCWWGEKRHCTFCGLNGAGMAFRAKSSDRALEEILGLIEKHGIRRVECVDNILDMRYLDSVLPRLAALEDPPSLFYEVKPNLRRDQIEQLTKAGIRWVQPGIESLDDRVLALLEKGSTGARNIQLLKWARELGCGLAWSLLYGAPGEQDVWYGEMAEWLPWLSHLQPPSALARIRYDRFSPYHLQPERFGIRLSPLQAYSFVFPFPRRDLEGLAYFFEDYGDLRRGDLDPTRPGEPRPGLDAAEKAIGAWR
ncbi:MAG: RiPP maturation radical SAM C-methyltransferase, partial [Holophagales bacterium]|nr:RiPP maturation radical SAM C-methyltransferase [Holophagales bacterium]